MGSRYIAVIDDGEQQRWIELFEGTGYISVWKTTDEVVDKLKLNPTSPGFVLAQNEREHMTTVYVEKGMLQEA